MQNPWNINSIYELQYFNCPSCGFKNSSKQEFINHAHEIHPECVQFLSKISDNSFSDVLCPWNEIVTSEIKIEENEILTSDIKIEETNLDELFVEPAKKTVLTDINVQVLNEMKIEGCINDLTEDSNEITSPEHGNVLKDLLISIIPLKPINHYCKKCDIYYCKVNLI